MGFISNLFYEQYFLSIPAPTASFAHKTVIITGSNGGLGKEAARHIAKLGCTRLILAVRNVQAGEEARKDIVATTPASSANIEVWKVDLGSFESVVQFCQRANTELDRLDVMICNAGINQFKYTESEGYETTLTVNVLSTYLMATQLLPLLKRTAAAGPVAGDPEPRPPHLTIIGSDTHLMANFPERNEPADKMLAAITENCKTPSRHRVEYANSKLMILLLGRELAQQEDKKSGVIINVANPGLCYSGLTRDIASTMVSLVYILLRARPTTMGAGALVNGAAAGWDTHGQFLSSDRVHQGSELGRDMSLAKHLKEAVVGALRKVKGVEL